MENIFLAIWDKCYVATGTIILVLLLRMLRIKNILAFKKRPIWLIGVVIIIVFIAINCLMADPTGSSVWERSVGSVGTSEDLLAEVMEVGLGRRLPITYEGRGGTFLHGDWLKYKLEEHREKITIKKLEESELIYGYKVYVDYLGNHILFYKENNIIVCYNGKEQGYSIPSELYDEIRFQCMVQSYLEHPAIINLVFSGTLTKDQSINETPYVDEYITFEFGDIICHTYERDGKYYCESPYYFIKEITKETYNAGVTALNEWNRVIGD